MVSTKGRYALRVMLDLAQHSERETAASRALDEQADPFTDAGSSVSAVKIAKASEETLADQRGSFIPLDEIAERQGVSKKYLEIILKVLVRHKLLKGLRGKGGGYKLTRSPKDYTVGEILTLTEGNLAVVSCLLEDDAPCMRKGECLTFPMWKKFDRMTHDFFFGITLADLIKGEIPTFSCP